MPASITIYNDSPTATDLQVLTVPGHSKAPVDLKLLPAEGEGGDAHIFELEINDVLIIRRTS